MTVGLEDPYELFWASARDTSFDLTPSEQAAAEKIERTGTNATEKGVVLALAAAFLLYRRIMHRGLRQANIEPEYTALQVATGALWVSIAPGWVRTIVPAVMSGYRQGMREAGQGQIPTDQLYKMANDYAEKLGNHIHSVSAEALLDGFQAQVNRKVVGRLALKNVIEAYGVPPRVMNALINVWSSEQPKLLTSSRPTVTPETRGRELVASELLKRSKLISENEQWATKSHAKLMAWLYAQREGLVSDNAVRVWMTERDERVCPICGPLHKAEAKLTEQFSTKNGEVWAPPLHPRCRCEMALYDPDKVEKARPSDPYDRDSRGRFSAVERRAPKRANDQTAMAVAPEAKATPDQKTAHWQNAIAFWEQRNKQMADLVRQIDPELFWSQTTGRAEAELRAKIRRAKNQAIKTKAKATEETKQAKELAKPLLRSGTLTRVETLKPSAVKLERGTLTRAEMDTEAARSAERQLSRVREALAAKPGEDVDTYTPLPANKMIYFVAERHDIPDYNGAVISTGDDVLWYSDDPADMGEDSRTPLAAALTEHWEEVKDRIVRDNYKMNTSNRSRFYLDEDDSTEWYIDEADFRSALDAAIDYETHGYEDDYSAITLSTVIGDRVEYKQIPISNLVDHLNLEEIISGYRPIILGTRFVNTKRSEIYPGFKGDTINPGNWKISETYSTRRLDVLGGIPYEIIELTPETAQATKRR